MLGAIQQMHGMCYRTETSTEPLLLVGARLLPLKDCDTMRCSRAHPVCFHASDPPAFPSSATVMKSQVAPPPAASPLGSSARYEDIEDLSRPQCTVALPRECNLYVADSWQVSYSQNGAGRPAVGQGLGSWSNTTSRPAGHVTVAGRRKRPRARQPRQAHDGCGPKYKWPHGKGLLHWRVTMLRSAAPLGRGPFSLSGTKQQAPPFCGEPAP
jgi:hypothetical protein